MSIPIEISICTDQDYTQILDELHEFWGARDTRHLHHPSSFTSLETRRLSFATEPRSSRICLAFFRRPNRSDTCIPSPSVRPPAGDASRRSFSATSLSSLGGMVASTSRRSPRRQIWSPSHFTKASACSSSAKPIAMEFPSPPTMPAAAQRAWSFGRRSRRPPRADAGGSAARRLSVIAPSPGRPSETGLAALRRQPQCRRGPSAPEGRPLVNLG
jgi:hypothetical protein